MLLHRYCTNYTPLLTDVSSSFVINSSLQDRFFKTMPSFSSECSNFLLLSSVSSQNPLTIPWLPLFSCPSAVSPVDGMTCPLPFEYLQTLCSLGHDAHSSSLHVTENFSPFLFVYLLIFSLYFVRHRVS